MAHDKATKRPWRIENRDTSRGVPIDIHNVSPQQEVDRLSEQLAVSRANFSALVQPKTCSDCIAHRYYDFGDGNLGPMVQLCPRHASVDDLYAAAKAALLVWVDDNPADCEARIDLRAAINKYEGRE